MMINEKERHLDQLALIAAKNVKETEYWTNRLSGNWVKSSFPFDHDPPGPGEETVEFTFSPELVALAVQISKGADVRLNIILATAMTALLSRYTGAGDIVFGMPIYKQETRRDFVNTLLVLRNQWDDPITFKALILQVRQSILDAVAHQNYPMEVLAHRLNLEEPANRSPFCDVLVLLENIHDRDYLESLRPPVTFRFSRTGESISGVIVYDTALYNDSSVRRIANHFMSILESALNALDSDINQIDIISDDERRQILEEFNGAETPYPRETTVHQLFEQQAEKTPDHIACVGKVYGTWSGKKTDHYSPVTFRQLNDMAHHIALQLRQNGIGPDQIAGIMLDRSVEMIAGLLGILESGGAYMPIDPDYPQERVDFMLRDSGAKIIVTNGLMVDWLDGLKVKDPPDTNELPNQQTIKPTNLAYIIYTSGTTGVPKGVMVEHRNVVAYLHSFYREFDIKETDTMLQLASYCFDVFTEEVYPVLLRGGKIVVPDDHDVVDFPVLLRLIREYDVTIIDSTPMLLKEFNKLASVPGDSLGNLHTVISGGDVLKKEHIADLMKRVAVTNTYGPTESTVCATYHRCRDIDPPGVPIGKPIANYRVYILDVHTSGMLQPIGVAGELCVSGSGLTRGYLNRPGLTHDKFVSSQELSIINLYRTGDLARWMPDGGIEFLGRIDRQVKVRGYRIEVGEIENRLMALDEVGEAVVAVRENRDGDAYLCAYIIPGGEFEFSPSLLRETLSLSLPEFMMPNFFVLLDRVPLTPNGKVDHGALPEPEMKSQAIYVAPRDEVEHGLARIWEEIFEQESIGIEDDFFDIGGHSLTGIRIANEIHKVFQVEIQFTEIFHHRTIKELALYIGQSSHRRYVSIEAVELKEYYPVSSGQKSLFIAQQMNPGSTAYNIPQGLPITQELDPRRLEQAFLSLIRRHEALRTSFETVDGQTVQRIHDGDPIDFNIRDYPSAAEFIRPFDLSIAPLLRVGRVPGNDGNSILMQDVHHIISDEVSHAVMHQDFAALYSGEQLPPLRLHYKDFSQWRRLGSQAGEMQRQETFWLDHLGGNLTRLNLPVDYPRPEIQDFEGRLLEFSLDPEVAAGLIQLSIEEDATLFMVFLALLNILLAQWCGQQDIVIGMPAAGRNHADLDKIIGLFINTLALRNYPTGEKTFRSFLAEVRQRTLAAFENQDYPFEQLVERIEPQRPSNRGPLFDILLSYHKSGDETGDRSVSAIALGIPELEGTINTAKFDITFDVVSRGEQFYLGLRYAAKLFSPETINQVVDSFRQLAARIVAEPGVTLSNIQQASPSRTQDMMDGVFDDLEDE